METEDGFPLMCLGNRRALFEHRWRAYLISVPGSIAAAPP